MTIVTHNNTLVNYDNISCVCIVREEDMYVVCGILPSGMHHELGKYQTEEAAKHAINYIVGSGIKNRAAVLEML